jgi:hypothetical protein
MKKVHIESRRLTHNFYLYKVRCCSESKGFDEQMVKEINKDAILFKNKNILWLGEMQNEIDISRLKLEFYHCQI